MTLESPIPARQPAPGTSLSILLRRAQAGETTAVTELVRRCEPRVRGLVAVRMGRRLIDLRDADDIVQEVLLSALLGLDRLEHRSEGGLICWLASIVESRIHDAQRRADTGKRGGRITSRRADLGITTLSALPAASRSASPSHECAAKELDGRLERALLLLGPTARRIVYCRLVLEMSNDEIAAELRLASADSARALLHKALAQLRQTLDTWPAAD